MSFVISVDLRYGDIVAKHAGGFKGGGGCFDGWRADSNKDADRATITTTRQSIATTTVGTTGGDCDDGGMIGDDDDGATAAPWTSTSPFLLSVAR